MNFDEYVGLPWLVGGRDRGGIDCYGLLVLVFREKFNIDLPLMPTFEPWQEIAIGSEHDGDGILLRGGRSPFHVGIVAGARWMLHIDVGTGVLHERYDSALHARRVLGFHRHVSFL